MIDDQRESVPLKHAMLCWNFASEDGRAWVVRHPEPYSAEVSSRTAGACSVGGDRDWPSLDTNTRLALMLSFAWQAVVRDGVLPAIMHEALSVIPEFRSMMTPDMVSAEWD